MIFIESFVEICSYTFVNVLTHVHTLKCTNTFEYCVTFVRHWEVNSFQKKTWGSFSRYRIEHNSMCRWLQNVITHLILYQLHQLIFVRMCNDLLLQGVAKKIKRPPRHRLLAWVRHTVVLHGWWYIGRVFLIYRIQQSFYLLLMDVCRRTL